MFALAGAAALTACSDKATADRGGGGEGSAATGASDGATVSTTGSSTASAGGASGSGGTSGSGTTADSGATAGSTAASTPTGGSSAATGGAGGNSDGGERDAAAPISGLASVTLDPSSVDLTIDYGNPLTPASINLVAMGTFDDGSTADVSTQGKWTLDAAPGSPAIISYGYFESSAPGKFTVTFRAGDLQATAAITVKVTGSALLGGITADVAAGLDGTPSGAAPSVRYPLDGALFPLGLATPSFQVTQTVSSQTVGRVAFQGDYIDLRVYAPCSTVTGVLGGCVVSLDDTFQPLLAGASEAGDFTTRVRLAASDGSGLGESAALDLKWTFDQLGGGLYYWSTGGVVADTDLTAIFRFNLDNPSLPKERYFVNNPDAPTVTAPTNEDHPCVGCHAISKDGTKLALTLAGSDQSNWMLVDVATKTATATKLDASYATFTTFSPDGSRMVNAFKGNLYLRNTDPGLANVGGALFTNLGESLSLPFWSFDGKKLAFVGWKPGSNGATASTNGDLVQGGEIYVVDSDGMQFTGTPKAIVARVSGRTETYPAISDDSKWVVFDESSCNGPATPKGAYGTGACDGYDDPSARLHLVSIDGGNAIDLAKANGTSTDTVANSWPRFSPTHGTFRGQPLYWIAFSSRRPYGFLIPGSNDGSTHPQLWFAAVMPGSGATATADPSFAPVWLPNQDDDLTKPTGNHVPQWVVKAVKVVR